VSLRSLLAFLAVVAVIGLLAFGLLNKGAAKIAVGEQVPDKVLPTLPTLGHGSIAEYRGKWVLVNLWASWCIPCREEAPVLQRFYERHKAHNTTVVGINVQDNQDDAVAFLHEHPTDYLQLRSIGNERSAAFGSIGVPENFLVNPKGDIAVIWRSPVDDQILRERFIPLIKARS
jgi:cytochrome c biogenesis protein CcmG, thiol:disulfide interchange protein DsbE